MTSIPNLSGIRRGLRAPAVVLAATALLVGSAAAAQAHNILVGTSPANGSVAAVVPAQVRLTFDKPALGIGTVIIVTGPNGQVQTGAAVLVDNTVTEHVQPGSPAGRYVVAWRVSSADGHPVSGELSFTASSPSPGQRATSTTSTGATAAGAQPTTGHGGQTDSLWWVLAGGAVALVLLVVFIATRRPRTTPAEERDPTP